MKLKIVVLSGAGISAESGLGVFRGSGGLWEGYKIEEVASVDGWNANPSKVLEFYNLRRTHCCAAQPNEAHKVLAELQTDFEVQIVTQNIDDLHEKAGSENVIHLHGKITQARSTKTNIVTEIGDLPIYLGDLCPQKGQLRPNIVWFGEEVPLIATAQNLVAKADIFVVVGTSLQVYPAAGLLHYAPKNAQKYLIDTNAERPPQDFRYIEAKATLGIAKLADMLRQQLK